MRASDPSSHEFKSNDAAEKKRQGCRQRDRIETQDGELTVNGTAEDINETVPVQGESVGGDAEQKRPAGAWNENAVAIAGGILQSGIWIKGVALGEYLFNKKTGRGEGGRVACTENIDAGFANPSTEGKIGALGRSTAPLKKILTSHR